MQDAIIMYENGKAIGGEGHPTNASDITFDNTGTDLVSENVEGAVKEVRNISKKPIAWTNNSPTSAFADQTVAIDLSDCNAVIVEAGYDNTSDHKNINNFIAFVGSKGTIYMTHYAGSPRQRNFEVTTTGIVFTATYVNGSSTNTDNTCCIPLRIFKWKF